MLPLRLRGVCVPTNTVARFSHCSSRLLAVSSTAGRSAGTLDEDLARWWPKWKDSRRRAEEEARGRRAMSALSVGEVGEVSDVSEVGEVGEVGAGRSSSEKPVGGLIRVSETWGGVSGGSVGAGGKVQALAHTVSLRISLIFGVVEVVGGEGGEGGEGGCGEEDLCMWRLKIPLSGMIVVGGLWGGRGMEEEEGEEGRLGGRKEEGFEEGSGGCCCCGGWRSN